MVRISNEINPEMIGQEEQLTKVTDQAGLGCEGGGSMEVECSKNRGRPTRYEVLVTLYCNLLVFNIGQTSRGIIEFQFCQPKRHNY